MGKNSKNHFSLNTFDDQVQAIGLAHALIAGGVDAAILPLWNVTVPNDQENLAKVLTMDYAENLGKQIKARKDAKREAKMSGLL